MVETIIPEAPGLEAKKPNTSTVGVADSALEATYEQRHAEGYDIYDVGYTQWLKASHLETLPSTPTQCSSQYTSSKSDSRVSKFLSPLPASVRSDGDRSV